MKDADDVEDSDGRVRRPARDRSPGRRDGHRVGRRDEPHQPVDATRAWSPLQRQPAELRPAPSRREYCADFRRAFAANLGVDESALAPAAKAAALATIDAAVADGSMTKAVGDRLRARIEAAGADGCALLAGRVSAIRGAAGAGKVRAALGVVQTASRQRPRRSVSHRPSLAPGCGRAIRSRRSPRPRACRMRPCRWRSSRRSRPTSMRP